MMEESSLEGTLDTVEYTLINLVRHYPVLYNQQDPGHRDKFRKDAAWTEIAKQLNKDDGWCYTKWQNLRDYYRKRKKIYEAGTGMSKRWIYYDAMTFLDPFESNGRESGNCTVGMIHASELSSSSSRSANDGNDHIMSGEGSCAPGNYFDETQYHSLDGVTERADVKLGHFLDPLMENLCPPSKRQKTASAASASIGVATEPMMSIPASSVSSSSLQNDRQGLGLPHVTSTPSIVSVQSRAQPISKTQQFQEREKVIDRNSAAEVSNSDCPHYLFCMSLAARFRRMDQGTATYMQMKIMELLLKAQHPDEYNRRKNSD